MDIAWCMLHAMLDKGGGTSQLCNYWDSKTGIVDAVISLLVVLSFLSGRPSLVTLVSPCVSSSWCSVFVGLPCVHGVHNCPVVRNQPSRPSVCRAGQSSIEV